MKKLLPIVFIFLIIGLKETQAQQYALFGTKTIFDAFENPSQKSFTLDSSRKFSSNFFLPYLSLNGANRGSASDAIRKLIQEGVNDTRDIPVGNGDMNHFYQNSNIYVATFRIFKSYKYQKEMGFSWQIRSDANLNYTNETLAVFDSYTRFPDQKELRGIFNDKGYEQTYHQFSFTYRENYDKQLAFGIKASLLSGILYNKIDINDSYFYTDKAKNILLVGFAGSYLSNFRERNEINRKTFMPTFANPGLSLGFGTNYTTKNGWFLMANVKDLGFIWWRKNTQKTVVDQFEPIGDLHDQNSVNTQIKDIFLLSGSSKKFIAPTNAKADIYLSKTYDFYKPALVVSKNLFYKGGDIAFVNTFNINDFAISATPLYNLNNIFMVGLQGKYQTPNFEVFMGTDNLTSTATQVRGLIKNDGTIGSGNSSGASFYMGVGIKFGNTVNHPQFSDVMPGINDQESSFFKRIFSVFKRNK